MRVACVGDVMLDVLVDTPGRLVVDDDTPARISLCAGGQAANVAAWVRAYGGEARVLGPRASGTVGRLVEEDLLAHGIDLVGPAVDRVGAVVALVSQGQRSLASDPGSTDWLDRVAPGPWLEDLDWLFVSGYALLRAGDPTRLAEVAAAARAAGAQVAVDLASAGMITDHGAHRFRSAWRALRPAVVFANEAEWAATHASTGSAPADAAQPLGGAASGAGGSSVLVLKRGPRGASFVIDGVSDDRAPLTGPVVDVTGAGDALAAGFLLGGTELAMAAAAACVARPGAQPAEADR